jgi:hypothetical protein
MKINDEALMKRIFRIVVDDEAPKLILDTSFLNSDALKIFSGESKVHLSPNKAFNAVPEIICPWQQIYTVAPGCFAVQEKAWEEAQDMYYVLNMGNELLDAGNSDLYYRIINPLSFAPETTDSNTLCNLDKFYSPIFRLKNYDPTDLFCYSGSEVSGDEFKYCYDLFGFKGLSFEEVW